MSTSPERIADALRASVKQNEQLRRENRRLLAISNEPVAIVGMACRYPGDVCSPDDLWNLVVNGRDAISRFPDDRGWNLNGLYHSDPDHLGTTYTREGGFIHEATYFDSSFFGIGPREALAIDPQQRVLLEVAWEAFERAGLDPKSLRGTSTGVFVGVSAQEYGDAVVRQSTELEGYLSTGIAASVVSGRVAYVFGLEGPALTIDTACSSSLVALHLACDALRSGECSLALAGGVTIMVTPTGFIELGRQRGLAPDGRCKSFGAMANGTGLAEGVGVVLVERLSDARRLGHRVLAILRGSAVNQDGASNGLSAPNGPSQERVIRRALENSGLSLADVDVVEGHGTGTTLGDRIEAQALLATYGQEHTLSSPLWLGSVKSNIGHCQAAAGVAGIIKMVCALQHELLPRSLHLEECSHDVEWSSGGVVPLTENRHWLESGRPRRAGVSSFGISGTNAHVILEQAPPALALAPMSTTDLLSSSGKPSSEPAIRAPSSVLGRGEHELLPLAISAHTSDALRDQAMYLSRHMSESSDLRLDDIGLSLTRRSAFEHRAVVLARSCNGLEEDLKEIAEGKQTKNVVCGTTFMNVGKGVAFLFPGQGSQWFGMGRELLESSPVFAEKMRECADALAPFVDWSLNGVLLGVDGQPSLDRVDVVQPALFAVMVSLVALWEAHGVHPDVVVGHSQGEIAAAHVAGALSLEDAARLVALRSQALVDLVGHGGMVSIALEADDVRARIERWSQSLSIAAVNGPSSVVVSGDRRALDELIEQCGAEDVMAREIPVGYASHSRQIDDVRGQLLAACAGIAPRSSTVPFVSTVTGGLVDTCELNGEYWFHNLRETVQFEQAMRFLVKEGYRCFVEISPHPVLAFGSQETIDDELGSEHTVVAGSGRREDGGLERFWICLAEIWVRGIDVQWSKVFDGTQATPTPLPTYAFQRERYWMTRSGGTSDLESIGQASVDHPLFGAGVARADGNGWLLTGRLSLENHPWLADHAAMGTVLLPGTAFLELALRAGDQVGCAFVQELTLEVPLLLGKQAAVHLQVAVSEPDDYGVCSIEIYSRTGLEWDWTRNASGVLARGLPEKQAVDESMAAALMSDMWPPRGARAIELDDIYERLLERGLEYGQVFQGLTAAWRLGDRVFAEVSLRADQRMKATRFGLHPALLDAALHPLAGDLETTAGMRLPFSWKGVVLHASGAAALRVVLSPRGDDEIGLVAADENGTLIVEVDSLIVRKVSPKQLGGDDERMLHTIAWREALVPPGASVPGGTMVFLGQESSPLISVLDATSLSIVAHCDLASLREAIDDGNEIPEVVLVELPAGRIQAGESTLDSMHAALHYALDLLQSWTADGRFASSRLVFITKEAVAAFPGDAVEGLVSAPVWGLIRSAQSESPGRFVLVDVDGERTSWEALHGALALGEPEIAVREGGLYVPRLERALTGGALTTASDVRHWRLEMSGGGSLEDIALTPNPQATESLKPGQVRIAMRAGGLNFRDVMVSLDLVSIDKAPVGGEGAGVVLETGPQVDDLAVGDRVMCLFAGGLGPIVIADRKLIALMPSGMSFAEAASIPIAFLTAYYGLVELAGLKEGNKVLIHAATGGVGMAALQLAKHFGAEVFATASPSKWPVLASLGIDESHIASSRSPEFEERFRVQTGQKGIDIVLNSLAGALVDASLQLLCEGGHFIEMGKTDVRDPLQVAERHSGALYRAVDLLDVGPERIQEMFGELLDLFDRGAIEPLPVTAWSVRRAPRALRFMSQARHVGKVVLSLPPAIDPERTVLITGGTGTLGALLARHLVTEHAVSHILLASRQGPDAEGAQELKVQLESLGAHVRIVACDVSDRADLAALLGSAAEERPLGAVVHAAGIVDDGLIDSLTHESIDWVLASKADAAWYLHELTKDLDLQAFVLFSSAAGTLGAPAQGNYAAASAFLDALAYYRRARGLPASSLAWGLWEQTSGITQSVSGAERSRMVEAGLDTISSKNGLKLFDVALDTAEAFVFAAPLRLATLRARSRDGMLPVLFDGLIRSARHRASAAHRSLARRLRLTPEAERGAVVLDLLLQHVAAVLGHASVELVAEQRPFKDLGFDSLAAVELRNRLNVATGLRLPATLVFDHPTPAALAAYLAGELSGIQRNSIVPSVSSSASDEPVAIVGIGCRYPGGVGSPDGLWQLVAAGIDGIRPFPSDRGWDLDALFDPDPDRPGTSYVRDGGFIDDAGNFDAGFFGISPREALSMDPQQRLLLEVSWEALEDAGIDPTSLTGSQTGVFTGIISSGYGASEVGSSSEGLEGYGMTGSTTSVASGRVAYVLGLEGPAVSVDTACSSSLVAMHLASQALRSGECTMALAGGVTVLATPAGFVVFSRQRGLARDGRCKPFADAADGTGFAEGVGVLVLERLSDAQRNGHAVLALIRGSAVNQDGASNGLSAPSGSAQQRVIAQALANARLSPQDVDVVEAHGTGTTLGDPIEAQAVIATYGQHRPLESPLWLGSVKSNIGHTAAAAGIAGVIKMVFAMRHGVLPRTLHVDRPSTHVDWSSGTVSLLVEERSWERNARPRRAGVSSFGVSGTNAHLILEEAPGSSSPVAVSRATGPAALPLLISARDEGALREQARRLAQYMDANPKAGITDIAYSLLARPCFECRAAALGNTRAELTEVLGALAKGEPKLGAIKGIACASRSNGGGTVFLFPGQGSQWQGMARQLLETSEVFRHGMTACGEALEPFIDWSLEDVVRGTGGAPGLERVDVVQPTLFAVMVSLADCWLACGVHPSAVAGHSQGEIAAACVAGGLSLQDAARVVALRSRALLRLAGHGGMVSVASPVEAIAPWLERWDGRLSVAAINGPSATVISGDTESLRGVLDEFQSSGVRARAIPVDYAAHSAQVEAIREELLDGCGDLSPRSCAIPFYSAVSGGLLDTADLDAEYWYRNLRQTVQFEPVIKALHEQGARVFIEVSPHPVLTVGVQDTVERIPGVDHTLRDQSRTVAIGSLRRARGGLDQFYASVAEAWVQGVDVAWHPIFAENDVKQITLPTYPFQRERYWLTNESASDLAAIGQNPVSHPLLGATVALAGSEGRVFTGRVSLRTHPWLADHAVMGTVLLPGTAFVELALYVGSQIGCGALRELVIERPLALGDTDAPQLQVVLGAADELGARTVDIYSRPCDVLDDDLQEVGVGWVRHAAGVLFGEENCSINKGSEETSAHLAHELHVRWPPVGAVAVDIEELYQRLAERGVEYGPAFRGVCGVWHKDSQVFVEVELPTDMKDQTGSFGLHPALLDAAFHAIEIGLSGDLLDGDGAGTLPRDGVWLPFSWEQVKLFAAGARRLRVALSVDAAQAHPSASLVASDEHGRLVATVGALVLRQISGAELNARRGRAHESLFCLAWTAVEVLAPVNDVSARIDVVAVKDGGLANALHASGRDVVVHRDLAGLRTATEGDTAKPAVVLVDCLAHESLASDVDAGSDSRAIAQAVHRHAQHALGLLQGLLGDERFAELRIAFVTRRALATHVDEALEDLAGAAVWGLVRAAQSESPGLVTLMDLDGTQQSWAAVDGALATDEPQIAVRDGKVLAPRLTRAGGDGALAPPVPGSGWRLDTTARGTLENLALVEDDAGLRALAPGEVRVAVRAVGLNFRDVLIALDMYPGEAQIGAEGAGVIVEIGAGVEALTLGDRVMGLLGTGCGPLAISDQRFLAPVPEQWSFEQAASTSAAFLTALYALRDLARVNRGERLLVHAATGGVGMAAVQLARHMGIEVYGTASPGKWPTLESIGFDETHIASSRTTEFRERFLQATGGEGVDVVLDCLSGELVDASLGLLPRGGRFIEMGKTDVRDPEEVAREYPGVTYRAFDLSEAGPERIGAMLAELASLFECGTLDPLPVRAWDVRRAPDAFRFLSQARHTGKLALRMPPSLDPQRTVLITGGTGRLGALVASHLLTEYGIRSLLLVSRRGLEADGAQVLQTRLEEHGARVRIAACDVSDRDQLAALLAQIPPEHPLGAVVHAAGMLDDGVIEALTPERLDRVLSAKVDGALHLHELTRGLDLWAFVLFSSLAGVYGAPGQGNYAAANAFLDALAAHRRACQLPATAMAWGLWEQESEMTSVLTENDHTRMERLGLGVLSTAEALELFDAAWTRDTAMVIPTRLNVSALRGLAQNGVIPPLLRELIRSPRRPVSSSSYSLASQLAKLEASERESSALELLRAEIAAVLGYRSPEGVDVDRSFNELGFDSLSAIELRNRLGVSTGLSLPATLIFDYPNPRTLTGQLLSLMKLGAGPPLDAELDRLDAMLTAISDDEAERRRVAAHLEELAARLNDLDRPNERVMVQKRIEAASDEEIFSFIDSKLTVAARPNGND